jgi:hypothetical protein
VCNPAFRYESSHNPRRVLTKPSKAAHNDGYDNEDYDYILYVNDILGSEEKDRYVLSTRIMEIDDDIGCQICHFGYSGPGYVRPGREVPEHQDTRSRCGEGRQEQAGVLQPVHDGGDDPRSGKSILSHPIPILTIFCTAE